MLKKNIIERRKPSIVTLDPYSLKSYRYRDNIITQESGKKFDDRSFYISYVQTKDIISSTVDIENNIGAADLADAIEIKAYDELGLESDKEYSIFYFQSNRDDGEYKVFNVIAIDQEVLADIFSSLKHIKYIDYITAAPFLMKSLYQRNLLPLDKTDCFVYFHKDDAFIVIYQNGEYVFSKSIKYSLSYLSDTFAKETGSRVDENRFFSMLQKSGIQQENSIHQQQLMKIFGEIFLYINDVILYAKRAYRLEKVDQILLNTEIGEISGLEEFCHSYINIETNYLDFKISKNLNEVKPEALHTIMIEAALEYKESQDESQNISIFKRPPPLKARPSGKLLEIVAGTLVLSLAYPAYQYFYGKFVLEKELALLNRQHQEYSQKMNRMKQEIAKITKENNEVKKKLEQKGKDLAYRTNLLEEIYYKKVHYPMKAKILTDLFDRVNRYKTKVVAVEDNQNNLVLTVRAPKDKYITELMENISLQKNYRVSTEMIKKDENGSFYQSAIKVGLHGNFK